MSKKYIIIIALLALTAFTSGYLLIEKDTGRPGWRSKTGALLEKFQDPTAETKSDSQSASAPLTDHKVLSATNSSTGSVVFYEKNTGKVFEVNPGDRIEKTVSDKVLANLTSTIWAPNKKDVISTYYSQKGDIFKYYDYTTKKTSDFSSDTKKVVFSPDSNLVAYLVFNPGASESDGSGKIFISQPDGEYPKKILNTRLEDVELYWPLPDQIAIKTKSSLFLLSKEGALTDLIESGSGNIDVRWSQDGKKLIFSYTDSNTAETQLWLKNVETKEETMLDTGFSASDCTWSIDDKNIICSTPQSRGNTENNIYQIDTSNASKKIVATSIVGVKDIFLSSLEDYIIFTSPLDEKLYAIKLVVSH